MKNKYENLRIWCLSHDLAEEIDEIVMTFPGLELNSLADQIRREANCVCINIVEGSTGSTSAEFERFLLTANRSALEIAGYLFLAKRRNYLDEETFTTLYCTVLFLIELIQVFINSLND